MGSGVIPLDLDGVNPLVGVNPLAGVNPLNPSATLTFSSSARLLLAALNVSGEALINTPENCVK